MSRRAYFSKGKGEGLFVEFSLSKKKEDTGSCESQIALFTHRITHLTNHLKLHKKDSAARRGLLNLVGKRKRLLDYLQRKDAARHRSVLVATGVRK